MCWKTVVHEEDSDSKDSLFLWNSPQRDLEGSEDQRKNWDRPGHNNVETGLNTFKKSSRFENTSYHSEYSVKPAERTSMVLWGHILPYPKDGLKHSPSLAHSGRQLLVPYETFDRRTVSRARLVLPLYDFLFLLILPRPSKLLHYLDRPEYWDGSWRL